jgi:hypothetical protein
MDLIDFDRKEKCHFLTNRYYYVFWIMDILTKEIDGTVFGGAVRDIILAQYNQNIFFEKHKINNNINRKEFEDKSVDPETFDRTLYPTDYDVYMTDEDFWKMMKCIYKNRDFATITIVNVMDLSEKYNNLVLHSTIHRRIEITLRQKCHFSNGKIRIDAIIIDNNPPFANIDCSVNALLYNNKYKIHTNSQFTNEFIDKTINQILMKETDITCHIQEKRSIKMSAKGWVFKDTFTYLLEINNGNIIKRCCKYLYTDTKNHCEKCHVYDDYGFSPKNSLGYIIKKEAEYLSNIIKE